MTSPIDPVYPSGFVRDLQKLLAGALRRFYNRSINLIRSTLSGYRDSIIDDLYKRLEEIWQEEAAAIVGRVRDMYRQLSQAHFKRWLKTLSAATGVDGVVFERLIREPWLLDEQQSRVNTTLNRFLLIGSGLLLAMDTTLRSGVRSGLLINRISEALRESYRLSENQLIRLAENQVQEYYGDLTERRHKDSGTTGYIWLLTVSKHPRKEHLDRVGHYFAYDDPPTDGHPGHAPNCKCGSRPAFRATLYGIPVLERYRHDSNNR